MIGFFEREREGDSQWVRSTKKYLTIKWTGNPSITGLSPTLTACFKRDPINGELLVRSDRQYFPVGETEKYHVITAKAVPYLIEWLRRSFADE